VIENRSAWGMAMIAHDSPTRWSAWLIAQAVHNPSNPRRGGWPKKCPPLTSERANQSEAERHRDR
jgi:hypothetical protein